MSRPGPSSSTVCLTLLAALALPAVLAAEVELLRVGEWHGHEVGATSSDGWLCLIRSAVGFDLRPCAIEVTAAYDPVVAASAGKKVSVPALDGVAFLLRGADGLTPGPVLTVFFGHFSFERGAYLPLGDEDGRAWLSAEPAGDGFDIALEASGVTQVLVRNLGRDEDAAPSLFWAGDLDRDGRLDYLLDTTDHYNVTEWTLFLSHGTGDGELVRRAAVFRTTGC